MLQNIYYHLCLICYLPPAANSRSKDSFDFFNLLRVQIFRYSHLGKILFVEILMPVVGDKEDNASCIPRLSVTLMLMVWSINVDGVY